MKRNNETFLQADVANLEAEIESLFAQYPELADDEALRADMIEGSTSAYDVLSRLLAVERDAETMVSATASRISNLQSRKWRYERRQAAMRSLMHRLMKAGGIPKAPLVEATLSVRATPAKVEILNERQLPKAYRRERIEPDKAAIKEALMAGKKVRGARMGEPGETIAVKAA